MKFPEKYKVVPVASDIDLNASATNPCDSINMKGFHHATFLINFQTLGGAAAYVNVHSGATDGALTSALTFNYAFMGAAAGAANCDVLGVPSTSAALVVAHATYDNYMLVVEVDASDMDIANGEEWLTLSFPDTATGATGNVSVVAILEPRYTGYRSLTALT
jgi:TPP-dependent trihydroxycyclohexane-1,2-dione (THcHDO) dehydratase